LRCVRALSLGNQTGIRDPAMHEVIMPHPTLTETGIRRSPAGCDDDRSNASLIQVKSMIEAGTVYRRWTPGILRRAEDHNRICRMNFLLRGFVQNPETYGAEPNDHGSRKHRRRPQHPVAS
jgi:hypothetical protein